MPAVPPVHKEAAPVRVTSTTIASKQDLKMGKSQEGNLILWILEALSAHVPREEER